MSTQFYSVPYGRQDLQDTAPDQTVQDLIDAILSLI